MTEELSCDISKFQELVCKSGRRAVLFVGKDFEATEPFLEELGKAYDEGFFGEMELAVISVDNEECDRLAEQQGIEALPTVAVYDNCKQIGSVTPTDEDARTGYRQTIERLIDLSE